MRCLPLMNCVSKEKLEWRVSRIQNPNPPSAPQKSKSIVVSKPRRRWLGGHIVHPVKDIRVQLASREMLSHGLHGMLCNADTIQEIMLLQPCPSQEQDSVMLGRLADAIGSCRYLKKLSLIGLSSEHCDFFVKAVAKKFNCLLILASDQVQG